MTAHAFQRKSGQFIMLKYSYASVLSICIPYTSSSLSSDLLLVLPNMVHLCTRVRPMTHGTEALPRVAHRGCHVLMATQSTVLFTCWNSDLIPVGKTAYSREDTSASHPLLYAGTTKDYIHYIDSRQKGRVVCLNQ